MAWWQQRKDSMALPNFEVLKMQININEQKFKWEISLHLNWSDMSHISSSDKSKKKVKIGAIDKVPNTNQSYIQIIFLPLPWSTKSFLRITKFFSFYWLAYMHKLALFLLNLLGGRINSGLTVSWLFCSLLLYDGSLAFWLLTIVSWLFGSVALLVFCSLQLYLGFLQALWLFGSLWFILGSLALCYSIVALWLLGSLAPWLFVSFQLNIYVGIDNSGVNLIEGWFAFLSRDPGTGLFFKNCAEVINSILADLTSEYAVFREAAAGASMRETLSTMTYLDIKALEQF